MYDTPECPCCGGEGVELGSLGHLLHLRCRQCGAVYSYAAEPACRACGDTGRIADDIPCGCEGSAV